MTGARMRMEAIIALGRLPWEGVEQCSEYEIDGMSIVYGINFTYGANI